MGFETKAIPSQASFFFDSDASVIVSTWPHHSESPLAVKFVSDENTDPLISSLTCWRDSVLNKKGIPLTEGGFPYLVGPNLQSLAAYFA